MNETITKKDFYLGINLLISAIYIAANKVVPGLIFAILAVVIGLFIK